MRPTDRTEDAKEIVNLVDRLHSAWTLQGNNDHSILDDKLADYVFFPLSQILRNHEQYPVRVSEAIVRLLRLLIRLGWKDKLSKELSQQLLLFFAFLVGGVPGQEDNAKKRDIPEETVAEAYRSLAALISTAGSKIFGAPASSQEPNQALSYGVTVILDGVVDGPSPRIQLDALECLKAVFVTVKDDRVLSTYLPGTVSALSKSLSAGQQATQSRVLIKGLEVLKIVLVEVLGDIKTRRLLRELEISKKNNQEEPPAKQETGEVFTASWLKATTPQVKIALSSVLKLRRHESDMVRAAVYRLCIDLLDQCHSSLEDCLQILVESAMIVEDAELVKTTLETSLEHVALVYPEIGDAIKTILYSWITGLPRIMQSGEEEAKQQAIRNILKGNQIATSVGLDSSTLKDALGNALRDSMVTLMLSTGSAKVLDVANVDASLSTSERLTPSQKDLQVYRPVLLGGENQRATRAEMKLLIRGISSPTEQVRLASEMLSYVQDSEGADQVAAYWLAFELLKATYEGSSDVDNYLDMSSLGETDEQTMVYQELHDFSVSLVASHSDAVAVDWRLEAIALEIIAFGASRSKVDFRMELIDVLYPVATFLGSSNPQLRDHAITTLNAIAAYSGYSSVSELIIENVDYMVNSVSLRLNTLDISPASTQVLTMMIRLTGPRLIPFLDDVVVAIFAALDNYHGYPLFVESIFSVLSEVVRQGVTSDALLLEDSSAKAVKHRKTMPPAASIPSILALLEEHTERIRKHAEEAAEDRNESTVGSGGAAQNKGKKVKSFDETLQEVIGDEDEQGEGGNHSADVEETKTSTTPTYAMLSRITTLTQHYLTSPTPRLRKSLLDLLATVSPALAPDENAFLPLVNALWPVMISRLKDPEPFVVIAACDALATLCTAAGDFLASRFKTEWAEGLWKWCQRCRDDATKSKARGAARGGSGSTSSSSVRTAAGRQAHFGEQNIVLPIRGADNQLSAAGQSTHLGPSTSAGLGRFTQSAQVWDAVVRLLVALVSHVRTDDDMFDQVLDLLSDRVISDEAVRETIQVSHPDAVWLLMYQRGMVPGQPTPELNGVEFAPMASPHRTWYTAGQTAVPIGL